VTRQLHIVCLDTPWPANYGGAIDMFNRIKALSESGVQIHLHYFSYKQSGNPTELNQYCERIHIYERKTGWKGFSFRMPYIVSSRINTELAANLNKDNHPILLEGVHCTGILPLLNKENRKIVVRLHNNESAYYRFLAASTRNLVKKIYYRFESSLLSTYEKNLPKDLQYACITQREEQFFCNEYGLKNAFFLPVFTPYHEIRCLEGMGTFCLYHGNLGVAENEKAAIWLLNEVFFKIKIPLVIAGKNPSRRLDKLAHLCQHTCLVANPSDTELNDLVRLAHINVLPSFSDTGIKVKLLHALFEGRHCITNEAMVKGTGLEGACHIGTNAAAFAAIVMQLHHQPFSEEEIRLRKNMLGQSGDNAHHARLLSQYLW
jgi:hypothetical protein